MVDVATVPIGLSAQKTWNLKARALFKSRLMMSDVAYGDYPVEENAPHPKWRDAFTVGVRLQAETAEVSVQGKRFDFTARAGQTHLLYLSGVDHLDLRSRRHTVEILLPRAFMREIADDLELPYVTHIGNDAYTLASDPFLPRLAGMMRPYFNSPDTLDPLLADQFMWTLGVYVMSRYGDLQDRRPIKGGLTTWQERLSKEMIATSLVGGTSLAELASACGVGISQFAHAFRRSTGVSPYRWLVQRRIDRAMLLLSAGQPVADAALACGFADQSHLTRTFRQCVGTTPQAWRRLQQTRSSAVV